ncbi:hypothetical protein FOL46_006068 [Perkinsus olseni]|uniref:Diacylglycerol kinase n=1 Tax=Perkinsus olseni TaxID=32597 RepID=A0A7J6LND4_PEROL|nr:hypothetical protein FOL46_006068 [Perkinsus olseni]
MTAMRRGLTLLCWVLVIIDRHCINLIGASESRESSFDQISLIDGEGVSSSSSSSAPDPHQVCKELSSDILILVNPKSGGNKAAKLLTIEQPYHHRGAYGESTIQVVDIFALAAGNGTATEGLEELKRSIDTEEKCERVIIAGGDGTVTWGVDLMTKADINLEKVVIGIIPYGTGNDFSQSLGWGKTISSDLPGKKNKALDKWIDHWMMAALHYFDLWQVTVELHPGGRFTAGRREEVIREGDDPKQNVLSITKPMSNYYSIGLDAAILKEFQKKRTQTRAGNHLMYAYSGMKKMVGSRVGTEKYLEAVKDHGQLLFNVTRREPTNGGREDKTLTKDAATIICLNTYTYAGGRRIWEGSAGKSTAIVGYQDETLKDKKQNFGDHKLEMMMYTDMRSFSLDAGARLKSTGQRLHQTAGPLTFEFKPDLGDRVPVDFQIDGEYTTAYRPKRATISHFKVLKVLINKPRSTGGESEHRIEKQGSIASLFKRSNALRRREASTTSSEDSPACDKKSGKGCLKLKFWKR